MKKSIILTSFVSVAALAFSATAVYSQSSTPRNTQLNGTERTSPRQPTQTERDRIAAPKKDGEGNKIVTTCTGINSCNDFIALCAASGGDFTPTRHDGKGRPSSGECKN